MVGQVLTWPSYNWALELNCGSTPPKGGIWLGVNLTLTGWEKISVRQDRQLVALGALTPIHQLFLEL